MTTIAPGFLSTDGGQIIDSTGKAVKLTGVNWFGAEGYAFAPQGLWMDSYQNQMAKMKELGFNVIRLPYSDAMLDNGRMPTGIDYSKNPDLVGKTSLQVFDKIIEHAGKIGVKIILDHHRSGDGASANENGLWYTSQYPESKMIENWKMLAERYKGNDAVIGADLHNEPHNPATWGDGNLATDWARAAERIGNAIQSVNKDWLLIVEGIETYQNQWYWWGGNLLGEKNYEVNFNTPNKLVYSVHDYGPSLHMMSWFNEQNFPNNMPAKWDQMWGHFIKNDEAPILVGEFGSRMETAIDQKWMPKLVQYMNGDWDGNGTIDLAPGDQGASWTYWAWSPGSGDTGGIMNDSWQVDYRKYDAIKAGLFGGVALPPMPTPPADAGMRAVGTDAADVVTGQGGNDTLMGGGGDDTIYGAAGSDLAFGNVGNDVLFGNAGADQLYGGAGDDVLFGGRDNDLLSGDLGADVVVGDDGDDTVIGGGDGDALSGGAGADLLFGNAGNDLLFGNAGGDQLFGGLGDDSLYGGAGADRLYGDLGNDRLSGDAGNDTLTGGEGADLFVFIIGGGRDRITDFNAAEGDRIGVAAGRAYTVTANAAGEAVLAFSDSDDVTLAGVRGEQFSADWVVAA